MAEFSKALSYALRHEGGWADDPDDPGGATNFGITLRVAQRHGIKDKEALRAISKGEVEKIYEADYWRFGDFNDQRVASKVFDMCVNMGLSQGVKYLQKALSVKIDGVCGPATTAAANIRDGGLLLQALIEASMDHYQGIAARRPASAKFLRGWLGRAAGVPNV
jgi:lysozyme family protein